MNFIGNRNFRAGPQTSLEGFICPQNSDKQQKIKVFGRSGGGELMKSLQYTCKLKWLSTILFVLINCFAYTYVGIRNNVVIEGNYFLC